jgi:hypothetical protein
MASLCAFQNRDEIDVRFSNARPVGMGAGWQSPAERSVEDPRQRDQCAVPSQKKMYHATHCDRNAPRARVQRNVEHVWFRSFSFASVIRIRVSSDAGVSDHFIS